MTDAEFVAFLRASSDPTALVESARIALPWDSKWDYNNERLDGFYRESLGGNCIVFLHLTPTESGYVPSHVTPEIQARMDAEDVRLEREGWRLLHDGPWG